MCFEKIQNKIFCLIIATAICCSTSIFAMHAEAEVEDNSNQQFNQIANFYRQFIPLFLIVTIYRVYYFMKTILSYRLFFLIVSFVCGASALTASDATKDSAELSLIPKKAVVARWYENHSLLQQRFGSKIVKQAVELLRSKNQNFALSYTQDRTLQGEISFMPLDRLLFDNGDLRYLGQLYILCEKIHFNRLYDQLEQYNVDDFSKYTTGQLWSRLKLLSSDDDIDADQKSFCYALEICAQQKHGQKKSWTDGELAFVYNIAGILDSFMKHGVNESDSEFVVYQRTAFNVLSKIIQSGFFKNFSFDTQTIGMTSLAEILPAVFQEEYQKGVFEKHKQEKKLLLQEHSASADAMWLQLFAKKFSQIVRLENQVVAQKTQTMVDMMQAYRSDASKNVETEKTALFGQEYSLLLTAVTVQRLQYSMQQQQIKFVEFLQKLSYNGVQKRYLRKWQSFQQQKRKSLDVVSAKDNSNQATTKSTQCSSRESINSALSEQEVQVLSLSSGWSEQDWREYGYTNVTRHNPYSRVAKQPREPVRTNFASDTARYPLLWMLQSKPFKFVDAAGVHHFFNDR